MTRVEAPENIKTIRNVEGHLREKINVLRQMSPQTNLGEFYYTLSDIEMSLKILKSLDERMANMYDTLFWFDITDCVEKLSTLIQNPYYVLLKLDDDIYTNLLNYRELCEIITDDLDIRQLYKEFLPILNDIVVNLNEIKLGDMPMINPDVIVAKLKENPTLIGYTKKDGTLRFALATLDMNLVPVNRRPKTERELDYDAIRYWDIVLGDWRTFSVDWLQYVEGYVDALDPEEDDMLEFYRKKHNF